MAAATAHLPRSETLIMKPMPDGNGGFRYAEITVGSLHDFVAVAVAKAVKP